MKINYFLNGSFWVTTNYFTNFLIGIVLSILFARFWPTELYGKYAFILSVLNLLSLTSLPGMGQAVLVAASENKDHVLIQAMKKVGSWSLIGSLMLILFALYFWLAGDTSLALTFISLSLIFPFIAPNNLYLSFLLGKGEIKKSSIYTILSQLISLFVTTLCLLAYPSLTAVTFLSLLSTSLINWLFTWKLTKQFQMKSHELTDHIKMGFDLSFSQAFTILTDYIDRLIIPILLGFTANAIYSFAILIPSQIHGFLKVQSNLFQPQIAALETEKIPRKIKQLTIYFFGITSALVIIYILLADFIFFSIYPSYLESVPISKLYVLSLLYFPANFAALSLVKKRRTKDLVTINMLFAVVSISLLIALGYTHGLVGIVISRIIARIVYAGSIYFYFLRSNSQP